MNKNQTELPYIPEERDMTLSPDARQQEVDELEAMFSAPAYGEHEADEIDQAIEAHNALAQPDTHEDDTAEIDDTEEYEPIETRSKKQKLRSRFSQAGLYLTATDVAGRIATRLREGREARIAQYEIKDGDKRRTRVRKFLGRNSLRIASGAVIGLGVGVAVGLRAEHTIEALQHPPSIDQNHADSFANVAPTGSTRYIVPGRGDPTAKATLKAIHDHGFADNPNTIRVENPAQMSPLPGDKYTLDQSSKIVSDKLYSEYTRLNGKPMEVDAYSLGTQGALDFANRVSENGKLPSNVTLNLFAPPQTPETGIATSPFARLGKPLLEGMGMHLDKPLPAGTRIVAENTDLIATGNGNFLDMLNKGIGFFDDGHIVPNVKDPIIGIVEKNGVIMETHAHATGPQTAALRTLQHRTNIPVTKAMDEFGQAIAPQGIMGQKAPQADAGKVIKASVDLIDEGLRDRKINDPNLTKVIHDFANNVPRPLVQQGLDLFDAPNKIAEAAVNQAPAPSGGGGSQATEVARHVATAPAPKAPVEQIQQTVNDTANNIKRTAPPQVKQFVDNAQRSINDLLKPFAPKK